MLPFTLRPSSDLRESPNEKEVVASEKTLSPRYKKAEIQSHINGVHLSCDVFLIFTRSEGFFFFLNLVSHEMLVSFLCLRCWLCTVTSSADECYGESLNTFYTLPSVPGFVSVPPARGGVHSSH